MENQKSNTYYCISRDLQIFESQPNRGKGNWFTDTDLNANLIKRGKDILHPSRYLFFSTSVPEAAEHDPSHSDCPQRLVAVHQWVDLLFRCRVAGSVHIDEGRGHVHERGEAGKPLGHLQKPLSAALVERSVVWMGSSSAILAGARVS